MISYVAIGVRSKGRWIFIRHRERGGYEIPAGHPEEGEGEEEAAIRELIEETGAESFVMSPVSYYSVESGESSMHGRLFFAEVTSFGKIKDIDEVESLFSSDELPDDLSLPVVMKALFKRLMIFSEERDGQI